MRGARLCIMEGRRCGVVEYSAEGRSVSYFVVPAWPGPATLPRRGEVRLISRDSYHVAAWGEPGLVHALVGDLPEATLVQLARLCMRMMMALLDPEGPRLTLGGRTPLRVYGAGPDHQRLFTTYLEKTNAESFRRGGRVPGRTVSGYAN
jgi:hypothetical protein